MKENKKLKAGLAAAVAIVTLAGTSAFADSRPQRGTRGSGGAIRRDAGASRAQGQRGNTSVTRGESRRSGEGSIRRGTEGSHPRSGSDVTVRGSRDTTSRDTVRGSRDTRGGRTYESDRDRGTTQRNGREEAFRRGTAGRDNRAYSNNHRNTQPYQTRGRIERYSRYRDGYRVWIGGSPYPFYVPSRYWHRDRFRVGLWISLGGYYNPLGYYDYYDGYRDGYYDGGVYTDRRSYSRGEMRGVVESVDSRRTSFVLRNEDTGSFVTILPRGRRVYVRPGDYVEVDGTWTRNGYFTAYDIDWLDNDRYDDRDRDDRYDRY